MHRDRWWWWWWWWFVVEHNLSQPFSALPNQPAQQKWLNLSPQATRTPLPIHLLSAVSRSPLNISSCPSSVTLQVNSSFISHPESCWTRLSIAETTSAQSKPVMGAASPDGSSPAAISPSLHCCCSACSNHQFNMKRYQKARSDVQMPCWRTANSGMRTLLREVCLLSFPSFPPPKAGRGIRG